MVTDRSLSHFLFAIVELQTTFEQGCWDIQITVSIGTWGNEIWICKENVAKLEDISFDRMGGARWQSHPNQQLPISGN